MPAVCSILLSVAPIRFAPPVISAALPRKLLESLTIITTQAVGAANTLIYCASSQSEPATIFCLAPLPMSMSAAARYAPPGFIAAKQSEELPNFDKRCWRLLAMIMRVSGKPLWPPYRNTMHNCCISFFRIENRTDRITKNFFRVIILNYEHIVYLW